MNEELKRRIEKAMAVLTSKHSVFNFDNLSDENARLMEQIQNQQKRRQMSGMTR